MRYGLTELTSATVGVCASRPRHVEHALEVRLDLEHARAVHARLQQLALGDPPGGHHHHGLQAGARGVGGRARGGVAGRRAQQDARALLDCLRDRDHHPAVLEGAGRVDPLEFAEEPPHADPAAKVGDSISGVSPSPSESGGVRSVIGSKSG